MITERAIHFETSVLGYASDHKLRMRAGTMWDFEGQGHLTHEFTYSRLQSPVASWGLGFVSGQRSKRSNTGGRPDQVLLKCSPSFPVNTGLVLSLGLQTIVRFSFLFLLCCETFYEAFLDSLRHAMFMTWSKCIQR